MSEFATPPQPPEATGSKETFNPNEFSLKEILKPSHTALIVVDVQNDFIDPRGKFAGWGRDVSQMQSTVPHIQGMIDAAHQARVPVIFTKGYEDIKYRSGPDLRRAVKWGEKPGDGSVNSEEGTFGSDFYQLQPAENDVVVEKHKWSAFDGKDGDGETLKEILDSFGVKTLVVTGVVAETCVETTIRDAYDKGYFTAVPKNSVGSNNPEQLAVRMKYWEGGFLGSDVVDESEIKEIWQENKESNPQKQKQLNKEKFDGVLRPVAEEDIPVLKEILQVWLQDSGKVADDEVESDLATIRQSLMEGSSKKMLVAQTLEGKVIGMMGLAAQPKKDLLPFAQTDAPSELIIAYVHPDFRLGKGVGTGLINAVQNLAKRLGKKEILLESGPRNIQSGYPFYDKQPGFKRFGIIKDFYGPGSDTVVWQKTF